MILRKSIIVCFAISSLLVFGCLNNKGLPVEKQKRIEPLTLSLHPMPFEPCKCKKMKDFNKYKIEKIAVLTFKNLEQKDLSTLVMPCGTREKYRKVIYLDGPGEVLASLSEKIVLESLRFEVIERRHLKDLLKEHQLNLSGIVKTSDIKKIGKITGVDALLLGEINAANGGKYGTWRGNACIFTNTASVDVSLRLVDIQTGKILWICSVHRTSLNYLKKPFSITANEAIKDMSKIRRALQGQNSDMDPIIFVAKNALNEALETLLLN